MAYSSIYVVKDRALRCETAKETEDAIAQIQSTTTVFPG